MISIIIGTSSVADTEKMRDVLLSNDLLLEILSYWDVVLITQKMIICRTWRLVSTLAIDCKIQGGIRRRIVRSRELNELVRRYMKFKTKPTKASSSIIKDAMRREQVELIANTYGWPIGRWDISQIRIFSNIFRDQTTFNEDISQWDVSNAVSMKYMFWHAHEFNQNIISNWDTSNVRSMEGMFGYALAFNNGSLSSSSSVVENEYLLWNTSKVENTSRMFQMAISFDRDISTWNLTRLSKARWMFRGAIVIPQDIISNLNTNCSFK